MLHVGLPTCLGWVRTCGCSVGYIYHKASTGVVCNRVKGSFLLSITMWPSLQTHTTGVTHTYSAELYNWNDLHPRCLQVQVNHVTHLSALQIYYMRLTGFVFFVHPFASHPYSLSGDDSHTHPCNFSGDSSPKLPLCFHWWSHTHFKWWWPSHSNIDVQYDSPTPINIQWW